MLRVRSFGMTDVGLLRSHNEDYLDVDDKNRVYVVADGMGGHNHGEVASRIAVETINKFIRETDDADSTLPLTYDVKLKRHSNHLKRSIHIAHDQVLNAIREDGSLLGMGTTVVGAMLRDDVVAIAHVGDSRAYRLRDGHLELLTQDHTWVNEQVVAGYLSEEQAKSHPLKNVVTRALGGDSEVVVDVIETRALDGDTYLLCSDGLTTMLSDQEIHQRLVSDDSLETICRQLIEDANARGGFDNVTVLVFKVEEVDEATGETTVPAAAAASRA
ncbi:MAG: Stp1/IreP family PP2C-type Ser/Thr phosphatase [Acidobacteria bacterium]|nr:MAG: Stp1/IreP family PP2C-type Ser/Thr phosphatase [Acidobacteriota bacterium]